MTAPKFQGPIKVIRLTGPTPVAAASRPAQITAFFGCIMPWPSAGDPGVINVLCARRGQDDLDPHPVRTLTEFQDAVAQLQRCPDTTDIAFGMALQSEAEGRPLAFKTIWLDLLLEPGDGGYTTVETALEALTAFVDRYRLPPVTAVVVSASTIRALWLSDRALPANVWPPYAQALQDAATEFGLRCDADATTNPFRALRVPGTMDSTVDPAKEVFIEFLRGKAWDFTRLKLPFKLHPPSVPAGTKPVGAPPYDEAKFERFKELCRTLPYIWQRRDDIHANLPCEPTDEEEQRDGRTYVRVRTANGLNQFVPKDELVERSAIQHNPSHPPLQDTKPPPSEGEPSVAAGHDGHPDPSPDFEPDDPPHSHSNGQEAHSEPSQFDWAAHMEAVALDILGEPNESLSQPPENVRFGNHGSMKVNYMAGVWSDFENNRKGGVKEFIRVHKGIEDRDEAIAYAKQAQENFENGGYKPRSKPDGGPRPDPSPHYQHEREATYPYHDASGQLAFEAVRFVLKQTDGSYVVDARGKRAKTFRQRRPSGEPDHSWLWGLDAGEYMRPGPGQNWGRFNAAKFEQYPVTRERKAFNNAAPVIPYQLPELIKAVAAGHTICIPEGEGKVDLIRSSLGFPATCCAGGANKWLHEHSEFLRGADVVLLPDKDVAGGSHINTILESLAPAARRIRILELPDLGKKGDVKDWHAAGGTADEFAKLIAAAPDHVPETPSGPQPLIRPLAPSEPYPTEALGSELADAAKAICHTVQSPIEMCTGAVLASASFVVSAHINILLPSGEIKPTSNWVWCIGISGERKTATDNQAFASEKQHQRNLYAQYERATEQYALNKKIWEAQSKAIDKQHKDPGAVGAEAHRKEREQLGPEPKEPLTPLFMTLNFTIEGLTNCLATGQPYYGIIGSEGAQFIGGHGMSQEAKKRTIGTLCELWDGEPMASARAKEGKLLYGKRAGMHLMVQPKVVDVALSDEMLIEMGFLGRILLCAPESLIGTRSHKVPPSNAAQILQQFNERIRQLMEMPYPLAPDTRNELTPRAVPFSTDATALFWEFHDEVERLMAPGGEYESIRAFAAKLPQHAGRIGATIAGYQDIRLTELSAEDFQRGMQIACWYASEAKRLCGAEITINSKLLPEQMLPPAQKLLEWIGHEWTKPAITARELYTHGPIFIRNKKNAIDLAGILAEHGWLDPVDAHQRNMKKWKIRRGPDR